MGKKSTTVVKNGSAAGPAPEAVAERTELLPVLAIGKHPENRRIDERSESMASLVESIRAKGIMVPLIVRPYPEADGYQVLAGHRRLMAAHKAGLSHVPAIVRPMDDKAAVEFVVCENLEREDPSPLEESHGVHALLDMGWDYESIASRTGRSASWVARRASLSKLTKNVMAAIRDPSSLWRLASVGVLESLARLPEALQDEIIDEEPYDLAECVTSATEFDKWVAENWLRTLSKSAWNMDDATLVPKAGACSACTKRSSCQPLLWEDDAGRATGPDRCLDAACWEAKAQAAAVAKAAKLRAEHGSLVVVRGGRHEDAEIKQAFGVAHVVDRWALAECKKSDKGAVPVIIGGGSNVGDVFWARPTGESKAAKAAAKTKTGPDGKATTTMAEKRAGLLKRRRAWVANEILCLFSEKGKLRPSDCWQPWGPLQAATFALAFGTNGKSNDVGCHVNHNGTTVYKGDPWDMMQALAGGELKADFVASQLLEAVKPVLHQRLRYAMNYSEMKAWWGEVEQIADVFGLSLDQMMRHAEEAIPEPKSWGGKAAALPSATGKPIDLCELHGGKKGAPKKGNVKDKGKKGGTPF